MRTDNIHFFYAICMHFVTGTSPSAAPDPVNKRLLIAVLLSVFLHGLVLSLQFGLPGLGLPGVELPWSKRRADLAPLSIQLADVEPTAPRAQPNTLPDSLPVTAPLPKAELPVPPPLAVANENPGLTLLAAVPDRPQSVAKNNPAPEASKPAKNNQKKSSAPPASASRPPPAPVKREAPESPVRIIAQEPNGDDHFVVPLPSPEEPEHKASEQSELAQKAMPVPAENVELAETLAAEQAAAKEKQDMLAQQVRQAAALAEQQAKQQVLKKAQDDSREQAQKQRQKQAEDSTRQQAAALALQQHDLAEEQRKRAQQQELSRIETAGLEELKRQQLASEREVKQQAEQQALEQRQQLKLQAAQRQKQAEELAAKQKAEDLLARQKQQEQQERSARQAAEQKIAEQKVNEQKLAEQKIAEQKIAEQKVIEQKLTEQKLAEQRAAEQTMTQQRAEQQRAEQQRAEQAAQQSARERALAASLAAALAAKNSSANAAAGAGADTMATAPALPKNIFSSDLANRAREQARGMDFLRGTPPLSRASEADERARRRSILGSIDREVPLRMYVDSWRQKIERNGNLNYSQIAKDKARGDPVVVVALRSDGSVEEITIVRSSGRADLDEAVRRIIRLNAPYAVFPPNIAAKYDVIEIRRVWNFDETLKILEEMR